MIRSEVREKLCEAALNPKNEFDRMLSENAELIKNMNDEQAAQLYMLQRKCVRLCRIVPYSSEDISEMAELVDYKNKSVIAELENCFRTAEYLLMKQNGN